jgi:hypothetical protein
VSWSFRLVSFRARQITLNVFRLRRRATCFKFEMNCGPELCLVLRVLSPQMATRHGEKEGRLGLALDCLGMKEDIGFRTISLALTFVRDSEPEFLMNCLVLWILDETHSITDFKR